MGQSTPIYKQHPSIPRVMCPRCGTLMRLAEVEPGDKDGHDVMKFDCDCSFEYRMSGNVLDERRTIEGDDSSG